MTPPAYFAETPASELPAKRPLRRMSAKRLLAHPELARRNSTVERGAKPIKANNSARQKRRREKNASYYKSAEWREKRRLTFERDNYGCTELVPVIVRGRPFYPDVSVRVTCPNRGEIVNGKQTARGLVCEESSYGHRGIPQRIDTCKTRCKECDRRCTPLERANHAHGFRRAK